MGENVQKIDPTLEMLSPFDSKFQNDLVSTFKRHLKNSNFFHPIMGPTNDIIMI